MQPSIMKCSKNGIASIACQIKIIGNEFIVENIVWSPFGGMPLHVPLQTSLCGKHFFAHATWHIFDSAFDFLVVSPLQMHTKFTHRWIHMIALRAPSNKHTEKQRESFSMRQIELFLDIKCTCFLSYATQCSNYLSFSGSKCRSKCCTTLQRYCNFAPQHLIYPLELLWSVK